MKITVFIYCLVVAAVAGAVSDSVQTSNSGTRDSYNSAKRDSTDQNANSKTSRSGGYQQSQQQTSQQHLNAYGAGAIGSYASATTPQVFYAKPEGGVQYAPNDYKGQYLAPAQIFIPQLAMAPQHSHPGQIQYLALAAPQGDIKQSGLAIPSPAIFPFGGYNGHPIQLAFAPISHPFGQIVKGDGVTYAGDVPQVAYLAQPSPVAPIAKLEAPVQVQPSTAVLRAPHPAPAYDYSIQPSVQISAGKQIITPTIATPHFKPINPPSATSYATFSQQLPVAAGAPVKINPVITQHVYPTVAAPLYPSGKIAHRSVGHEIQDAAEFFSHPPEAIHYGTHLYHPSLPKFQPFFG